MPVIANCVFGEVLFITLDLFTINRYKYFNQRPHTKNGEGYVFTGVCLFTGVRRASVLVRVLCPGGGGGGGSLSRGSLCHRDPVRLRQRVVRILLV